MKLNEGQLKAKKEIEKWLEDKKSKLLALTGAAGCGKTTVLKYIDFPKKTIGVAPTHQAKDILSKSLEIECKTIASVLFAKEEYNEDKVIFIPNENKWQYAEDYDLLIIDESSMISPKLFDYLTELYCYSKILFVGDKAQLPSIDDSNYCVFDNVKCITLTENMRSGEDNPILELANVNRNTKSINLLDSKLSDNKGFIFYPKQNYLNLYKENLIDLSVCYTNKVKDYINKNVHNLFFPNVEYGIGEKLISNENIDYYQEGDKIKYRIYNSDRLIVTDNLGVKTTIISWFDRKNQELFSDSFQYWELKTDKGVVNILLESEKIRFKRFLEHNKKYIDYNVFNWEDWHTIRKTFHDIVYGYACTSHKVQGSTYDNIAVVYTDIESSKNKKVKVSSFYTAITRARNKVYILK
jgi:exodeoxyribonuclease V alpha subunit